MTDAEIKKDLLFVAHYCHDEYNEIRVDVLLLNALDLINRQQAEIESVNKRADMWHREAELNAAELIKIQAEIERLRLENEDWLGIQLNAEKLHRVWADIRERAIEEFAERLKENCKVIGAPLITNRIDNLVKEMVGDAE